MDTLVLVRYFHFLSMLAVVSMVIAQNILVRPSHTPVQIRQLAWLDNLYGAGAIGTLVTGFLLWFAVGKSADYYAKRVAGIQKPGIL